MPFEKARILLIDDEPLVLDMYEHVLQTAGHEVITAGNSFEAIKTIREEPIDMVICDVRLHPFDGFEIMERAQEQHPQLPVILMTGSPRPGDEERLKGRNTVYLLKPISLQILEEIVNELLRQSSSVKHTSNQTA
jgi:DNA-binding NtrC family response regulator